MSKKIKHILFFLFIPMTVLSQGSEFNLNKGRIKQKDYFIEIPFEFSKGQIIVNVSINGKIYRFSIDTGAPTSISDSLYNKLNLSTIHKLELTDANNEKDSVVVGLLNSLNIGSIEIENTPVLIINSNNPIYKCLGLNGNIGSNSLRNSVIQFSLPDKMVRITDKVAKLNLKRKHSQKIQITPNQSNPFFWIKLKGRDKGKLQLLFDSGMEGFMDISLRNFYIFKKYDIFRNIVSSEGNNRIGLLGNTNDTLHYRMTVPKIEFGKIKLHNSKLNTTKSIDSRIGTKLLEYSIVTLDYSKEKIYFTPINDNVKDIYEPTWPVEPTFKDDKFQVGFIWNPDKYSNINLGDEIVYVNDFYCRGKDICEIMFFMKSLDDNKIKMITENKEGKQYTSTIIKE